MNDLPLFSYYFVVWILCSWIKIKSFHHKFLIKKLRYDIFAKGLISDSLVLKVEILLVSSNS